MIHIEQNQKIIENENLYVATQTGDYADDALIEFYDIKDPSVVLGAFQAQYVKYGSIVYRYNTPLELGKIILEIDPDSTHTAAAYLKMSDELLNQMTVGTLEPDSLDQVIVKEQSAVLEKIQEDAPSQGVSLSESTQVNSSSPSLESNSPQDLSPIITEGVLEEKVDILSPEETLESNLPIKKADRK